MEVDHCYGPCSDDDSSSIPEMIMTASLSTYTECDDDSLPSTTRLGSSQRSIFGSYWSSPTHTKSLETNGDDDELMLMVKLKMLKSPSISNTDDASRGKSSDAAAPKIVEATITKPFAEPNKSFTDDSFDYQSALVSEPPRRTPRRQILPTPPPPTAMSSSLLQPRLQQHLLLSPLGMERKGFSTSVLLKRPQPSCLRKSRYPSCDATMGRLHHGLRNNGYSELNRHQTMPYAAASGGDIEPTDLKKSVSFYAQVKVLEFSVPRERRSDIGWSKQFA